MRNLSCRAPGPAAVPSLDTCSNHHNGRAAARLVVLPGTVRKRAGEGPGRVLVSWQRCHCAPAREAYPERAAQGAHDGGVPGARRLINVLAAVSKAPTRTASS